MSDEKFRNYLQRRISPQEDFEALLEFPRFFEIETVNTCNARCPMCTIDEWTRHSPTMKMDLFRKLADEIGEFSDVIQRVSLYRDGEPLLDKKMPERIAYLKDKGVKTVSIATNVSLLNEKNATDILKGGIDHIILSIDSLQKEVFESIRVRLNFEEVLENALRFIELRNAIRPEAQIVIRMIRQEGNMDEWPSYHDFWSPKVAPHDRVYFHNLHNWGSQLTDFQKMNDSFEPQLPCVALWSLLVIFANGDVPLCNVDFNNKFPTGSVMDNSIRELWQSKVMSERRRLHFGGNKSQISLCANCNVWEEPETEDETISEEFAEKVAINK